MTPAIFTGADKFHAPHPSHDDIPQCVFMIGDVEPEKSSLRSALEDDLAPCRRCFPTGTFRVGVDECEAMCRYAAIDWSLTSLSTVFDRSKQTIQLHLSRECNHRAHEPVEQHEILQALDALAADLGRVPTRAEWDAWSDAPIHSSNIASPFEDGVSCWSEVLELKEWTTSPGIAPQTRAKIYAEVSG